MLLLGCVARHWLAQRVLHWQRAQELRLAQQASQLPPWVLLLSVLPQLLGLALPQPGVVPRALEAGDGMLRLSFDCQSSSVPFDGSFLKR